MTQHLFPDCAPAPLPPGRRPRDRGELPASASAYRTPGSRPGADPIGHRGLPAHRDALDMLVAQLCQVLRDAAGRALTGHGLGTVLCLAELHDRARAVRELVAYARVWHHEHRIIGVPGEGYVWADAVAPGKMTRFIQDAERRGRCYFYIAALAKRQGVGVGITQLVLAFMADHVPVADRHRADDLAVHLAAEGFDAAAFLDAFIGSLGQTDRGREVLAQVGRRHAGILVPADVYGAAVTHLEAALAGLRRSRPAPTAGADISRTSGGHFADTAAAASQKSP